MTQALSAAAAPTASRRQQIDLPRIATHVIGFAVPALCLSWVVHGFGGRDLRPVVTTIVLAAAAAVALRAWALPRWMLATAGVLVTAALTVALVHTPTDPSERLFRWPLADGYILAALTFLDVTAYVRRVGASGRRTVALAVAAAGPLEFAWSFTAWWAGGQGGSVMVGTFYWHNQYATYLVLSATVGLAVALDNRHPWRILGWLSVSTGFAGCIYSTSRASLALLAMTTIAVAAYALAFRQDRRRSALIMVGLAAVTAGLLFVMSHPPLMNGSSSPFQTEQTRTQGQSLASNGGYRLDFWRDAVEVGIHHPVLGAGGGALARASQPYVPANFPTTPFAHNGVLQAFADGGLVLFLPLATAVVAIGAACVARARAIARRRDLAAAALILSASAALAHSLIDFDWSYPALFALGAIVAALACDAGRADPTLA